MFSITKENPFYSLNYLLLITLKQLSFEQKKCLTCKRCELQCGISHKDITIKDLLIKDFIVSNPRLKIYLKDGKPKLQKCMQCKKPKCIEVCEPNAIFKREDGLVLIDYAKCNSCMKCINACPFHAMYQVDSKPIKCDLCFGNPECVKGCKSFALTFKERKEV